jgi:ketosteroid isomerase-like protein
MPSEEDQIRALIEERVAAMRQRDVARTLATLATDVVSFELAPPLSLGPAESRDATALEAWFALWGELDIELAELEIAACGDVAWSRSLNRLSGTLNGGRRVDMWMRSTLGFRKREGVWKIAHGHSSVPFLMDGSYRAATDLKPGGA